jgi:signal transduction histidine kinase
VNSAAQALERLKSLARLLLAASLGLAFLLVPPRGHHLYPLLGFVLALYFLYSSLSLLFYRQLTSRSWQLAVLTGDLAALAVVLLVAPSHSAAFILFFLYMALQAGLWHGWWAAAGLSVLLSGAYLAMAWREAFAGASFVGAFPQENWVVIGGLVAAGALVGTLAQRERRRLEREVEVEDFARLLSLDTRWPELWTRWLGELSERFRAREALLAYHNPETDRVVLWRYASEDGKEALEELDRPPRDARTFMLDATPLSVLGHGLKNDATAKWHLRHEFSSTATVQESFFLPGRFRSEFSPASMLSVPVRVGEGGRARVFLLDARRGEFTLAQFDELQGLLSGLAPMLANLLTVRSLIAQAVNHERDDISRALHDGVAQTLASLEMQLKVYQRLAANDPQRTAEELAHLQSVVKQEQEGLRRFIRTLKPVRVPAGELRQWMLAHCAQFQQETGIEVSLDAKPVEATLPEGVCREVFQILREALHNVRKHAQAKHVFVRLLQDDSCLRLQIEDDGRGFSFSGSYAQEALEQRGLLPVSIGEHARAVGGLVTIDSTPGRGATLHLEIPLD